MLITENFTIPFVESEFFHILIGQYQASIDSTPHMESSGAWLIVTVYTWPSTNLAYRTYIVISKHILLTSKCLKIHIFFSKPDFVVPVYTDMVHPLFSLELGHWAIPFWAEHTVWNFMILHFSLSLEQELASLAIPAALVLGILLIQILSITTRMNYDKT